MERKHGNRIPAHTTQPPRSGSWRSGIYTQQLGRDFIFSRRRMRSFPMGSVALAALCIALVIVTVLAGHAAVQDTLRWQQEGGFSAAAAGSAQQPGDE